MEKQFLQGVSRKERIRTLTDNAEKTEEFIYHRELSEEELSKLREDSVQHYIKLDKLEELKKEFTENHKAEVNPIKTQVKVNLHMLRTRTEEVSEEVYLLADQDEGMMGYYNAEGILVHQRSLLPNERQFRIVDESKNGTNN